MNELVTKGNLMSYHHFTIDERESILIYRTQGLNFSQIAKLLHRHPSSISREWKRHLKEGSYSPSHAQESYHMAKSHCGRKRMLEIDHNLSNTVKHLFLDYQWSPEEIEGRLRIEYGKTVISYQTIYRAIYRGHFDDNSLSHGARSVIRKLRHRGKTRHTNGLLREYFPKGSDLTLVDDQTIQLWENKLNNRPRKCLNWKTPYEVFYGESMHLI